MNGIQDKRAQKTYPETFLIKGLPEHFVAQVQQNRRFSSL